MVVGNQRDPPRGSQSVDECEVRGIERIAAVTAHWEIHGFFFRHGTAVEGNAVPVFDRGGHQAKLELVDSDLIRATGGWVGPDTKQGPTSGKGAEKGSLPAPWGA